MKTILESDCSRKIVVVSAPGKSEKWNTKITDLLIDVHLNKKHFEKNLLIVQKRFEEIAKMLGVHMNFGREFAKIRLHYKLFHNKSYLFSRGECIMAKILAKHLGFHFVDAAKLIKFDFCGKILQKTYKNIRKITNKYQKVIIPGFYGSNPFGKIKVMSRGGSDITGAIVTKAIPGSIYENWTDVDGVFSVQSKINNKRFLIKQIDYASLKALSLFGATVLHHKCFGLLQNHTTIIKNTFNPDGPGTVINNDNTLVCATSTIRCCKIIFKPSKRIERLIKKAGLTYVFSFSFDGFKHFYFVINNGYFSPKFLVKIRKKVLFENNVKLVLKINNGKMKIVQN